MAYCARSTSDLIHTKGSDTNKDNDKNNNNIDIDIEISNNDTESNHYEEVHGQTADEPKSTDGARGPRVTGRRCSVAPTTDDPRLLIPELCNHFYHLGWASGTGGGLSIRQNGRIYCAPSGVQKERIKPEDMFVLDETGQVLERPDDSGLKCSECLSLFMVAFKLRKAGCCIHSHSINANLITALCSDQGIKYQSNLRLASNGIGNSANRNKTASNGAQSSKIINEFRITNQEMIKGIKLGSSNQSMNYNDTLIVPIIDNVLHERDLAGAMHDAVSRYPDSNAVLVRNHGVYVWGKNWMQAKSMAECYDYLFKLKLEAVKYGLDRVLQEPDQLAQGAAGGE